MKGYNIAIFTSLIALGLSFGYIHIDKRIESLKEENRMIKTLILQSHGKETCKHDLEDVKLEKEDRVMEMNADPCADPKLRHPYCDDYEKKGSLGICDISPEDPICKEEQ